MNEINPKPHKELELGYSLLMVTDSLVKHRDLASLYRLHEALVELILHNVTSADVSLIELAEYIEEATKLLEAGKSASQARQSNIRKLLDT